METRSESFPPGERWRRLCRISEDLPKGIAYFMSFFFPVFMNNLLVSNQNPESHNLEYKMIVGRVEKR